MSNFKKQLENAATDKDAGPLFALSQILCLASRVLASLVLLTLFAVCLNLLPAESKVFVPLTICMAISFGFAMSSVWANQRATEIVLDR